MKLLEYMGTKMIMGCTGIYPNGFIRKYFYHYLGEFLGYTVRSNLKILGFLLWVVTSCSPQPDSRIVEIDTELNNLHQQYNFNGNVLIAEKGNIVYERSFGYASIERKDTLTHEKLFNIASISKTFTALCVMQLVEAKSLRLEDDISLYFPDAPYEGITIENLLTHTSGLPRMQSAPFRQEIEGKGYTNTEIKEVYFEKKPSLHFRPGTHQHYANTSYMLLALIIEKVSEQGFPEFLKTQVFDKAGMQHTFLRKKRVPEVLTHQLVSYYTKPTWLSNGFQEVSQLKNRKSDDLTFMNDYGSSAIYTTARDLLKYHKALQNGRLLSAASLKRMYTPFALEKNKPYTISPKSNYPSNRGLSWCIAKEDSSIVYHSGGSIGGRNFMIRNLEKDQCVIFLTNNQEMNRYNFSFPMKVLNQQDYDLDPISLARAFCSEYVKNGMDAALDFYEKNHTDPAYTPFIDFDFEEIGNELVAKNDLPGAIALYQLYVSAIPDEFSWELLGNAYALYGNYTEARKCLEKSLELNPKHQDAQEALNKLQGGQ